MICDRCGRDNPDQLTFCQDCGRRLAQPVPIAPPTPPVGLPLVAPPIEPSPAAGARSGGLRPEAPAFSFGPSRDEEGPICTSCGTRNPLGTRFCVACGAKAEAAPAVAHAAAASAPVPSPAPPAAYGPPPAPSGSPLVGARVVNLAPEPAPPAPAPLLCQRCNGANDAGMRFCKFCGAPLRAESPTLASPRPIPSPVGEPPILASPAPPPVASPLPAPAALAPSPAPPVVAPLPVPATTAHFAPAAAAAPSARLVTIAKDGSEGATFPLASDQVDLGRQEGAILLPDDPYVSPRHARFVRKGSGWVVRDLESVNRIFLRLRGPKPLVDSDLLLVGLQVLRFESVTSAEQGLGPATEHGTLLFGSPILPRWARLCQRTVEGVTCNVYYLHRDETTIGRESGDVVFTDDPFLSRRHVAIRRDPAAGAFTVEDLGSSNGTYLAIHGEIPLEHGDHLRVGQHLFRFDLADGGGGAAHLVQRPADGGARRGA